jgi:hypothetical protein
MKIKHCNYFCINTILWLCAKRKTFRFFLQNSLIFQQFSTINVTSVLTFPNLALNYFFYLSLARLLRIFASFLNQSFSKLNDISSFRSKHWIRFLTMTLMLLVMNKQFYLLFKFCSLFIYLFVCFHKITWFLLVFKMTI